MSVVLPASPRQLRWMLARKLSAAAFAISIMAGGAAYLVETRRAEQAALERATDGARHFVIATSMSAERVTPMACAVTRFPGLPESSPWSMFSMP